MLEVFIISLLPATIVRHTTNLTYLESKRFPKNSLPYFQNKICAIHFSPFLMKCRHSILPYDNKQAIVSAVGLLNLLTLLKFRKNAFWSASSSVIL